MFRYFNCECCGEQGIDRSSRQNKRFCSTTCANKVYRREHGIGVGVDDKPHCKFNEGVECYVSNCASCGWNPAVAQRRLVAVCQMEG